jgi:hypothetical protein
MELDPGIHIVMHSVLSLKTGCDTSAPATASPSPPSLPSPLPEGLAGSLRRPLGWRGGVFFPGLAAGVFPGQGNGQPAMRMTAARGGVSGALEAESGDVGAAWRRGLLVEAEASDAACSGWPGHGGEVAAAWSSSAPAGPDSVTPMLDLSPPSWIYRWPCARWLSDSRWPSGWRGFLAVVGGARGPASAYGEAFIARRQALRHASHGGHGGAAAAAVVGGVVVSMGGSARLGGGVVLCNAPR